MIPGDAGEHKLRMHEEIKRTVKDVSHLVLSTDVFFIRDWNDHDHRVLVFPVRGPGLDALPPRAEILRATRVIAAKQLLF